MGSVRSLNFNGIATISDLQTEEWKSLFRSMEAEQAAFLAKEHLFRSPEYAWPRDPLHTWSRLWEYPYAYFHIENWLREHPARPMAVADVGSGVTFFPFQIAKLGATVICTDNDVVTERDIERASAVVESTPGAVEFRRTDGQSLPFKDAELDVIYCISVLEHVDDIASLVQEIARSLKPGALFVLTIDLDLRGDQDLGVARRIELGSTLDKYFEAGALYRALVHPGDILQSNRSLYPVTPMDGLWWNVKQHILKPLLRRKPRNRAPFHLAVEGFVMNRKK